MPIVLFKRCGKCQGDLIAEGDEWRCFQCGIHYYPENSDPSPAPDSLEANKRYQRIPPSINSRIANDNNRMARWWERNKKIIADLDSGIDVKEIAKKYGKTKETIRKIRSELEDFREQSGS